MKKLSKRLAYFISSCSPWVAGEKNQLIIEWWYRWDAIHIVRHLRAYGLSDDLEKVIYDIIYDRHGEQVTEQMCSDVANWLRNLPPGSLKWGKLV